MRQNFFRAAAVLAVLLIFPAAAGAEHLVFSLSSRDLSATADERQSTAKLSTAENSTVVLSSEDSGSTAGQSEKSRYIVAAAAAVTDSKMSDEALKAVLAVCKNNYEHSPNNGETADGSNTDSTANVFTNRLFKLLNGVDIAISYGGRCVYIPITRLTNGNTATSDEYGYLQSVASPWDVFSSEFDPTAEYGCGVSAYGLQALCESTDSRQALRWYLPGFDVK